MDRAVLSGTAVAAQDTATTSSISETPRNGRRQLVLDMIASMFRLWFLVWDGMEHKETAVDYW